MLFSEDTWRYFLFESSEDDRYFGYDSSKERWKRDKKIDRQICFDDDKVKTIINVYNQAEPEEKEYFGKWYEKASEVCKKISEKYQVPFETVCAVMAILSPGNRFVSNITAVTNLLENFKNGKNLKVSSNNPRNGIKARRVLETGDLSLVTGPKVIEFFSSLKDPNTFKERLVLDGHAISIWLGKKLPLKTPPLRDVKNRKIIIEDYKKAAECLGISLQELQAVTWFVWKNTIASEKVE